MILLVFFFFSLSGEAVYTKKYSSSELHHATSPWGVSIAELRTEWWQIDLLLRNNWLEELRFEQQWVEQPHLYGDGIV